MNGNAERNHHSARNASKARKRHEIAPHIAAGADVLHTR
jgi:hypothetical protein